MPLPAQRRKTHGETPCFETTCIQTQEPVSEGSGLPILKASPIVSDCIMRISSMSLVAGESNKVFTSSNFSIVLPWYCFVVFPPTKSPFALIVIKSWFVIFFVMSYKYRIRFRKSIINLRKIYIVAATANEQTIERDVTETGIFKGKIFQFVKAGSDKEVLTVIGSDANPVNQETLDAEISKAIIDGKLSETDAANGHWNYLEQNWKFDASGKDKSLTYSDFGFFTSTNLTKLENISFDANGVVQGIDHDTDHEAVMVFAGGYDILPETIKPGVGDKYEGTAIGVINTSIEGDSAAKVYYGHNWGDTGHTFYNQSETAKLVTQKAELEIDANGKTVIYMPFGSDGSAKDVRLTGEDANVQWYDVRIEDRVMNFITPNDKTITKRFEHDGTNANIEGAVLAEKYYGVTKPEEATGMVVFEEKKNLSDYTNTTREFDFQAAYGMGLKPVSK